METIDGGQLLNGDFPGQSLDLGKEKAGLVVLIGENGLRGDSNCDEAVVKHFDDRV